MDILISDEECRFDVHSTLLCLLGGEDELLFGLTKSVLSVAISNVSILVALAIEGRAEGVIVVSDLLGVE